MRNPGATDRRKVTSSAKEAASPNTVVGDPTLHGGGAVLTVNANGTSPTTQTFNLPQGISVTGRAFWSTNNVGGFKYRDRKGEQGPVRHGQHAQDRGRGLQHQGRDHGPRTAR